MGNVTGNKEPEERKTTIEKKEIFVSSPSKDLFHFSYFDAFPKNPFYSCLWCNLLQDCFFKIAFEPSPVMIIITL